MTTKAQISANRVNAQKSTGPRTAEDKAVASQNAVTHGFLAQETVIPGEDTGEFALYREGMLGDLAPVGDGELDMAERIIGLGWRLRRAERLQTQAFNTLYEKMAAGTAGAGTAVGCTSEQAPDAAGGADDRILGRMLVEDFSHDRVLDKLSLYERRIETSMYRTMRELREQKRMRLAGGSAEMAAWLSARGSGGTGIPSASVLGQGLAGSWDHGQDAHATHGRDAHATGTQGALCKTNPISAGAGGGQGLGGPEVGDGWSRRAWCETNPIDVGTGESRVPGGKEGGNDPLPGKLCETNPISRGDSSVTPAVRRVA